MGANYPAAAVASSVRRPRGFARINGTRASCLGLTVGQKKHFASDTFSLSLEPWQQPEGFGLNFWGAQAGQVQVELLIGYLGPNDAVEAFPSSPTSMILGIADKVSINPLTGKLAVTGRDLTQGMIDTKFSNLWPDATASSIAQSIAANHGFATNITATSTPIGQYAEGSYGSVALGMPEWDVLAQLAKQEGFDAYMQGNTLYFGPPQTDSGPFVLDLSRDGQGRLTANFDDITLERDLTRARPINVTVLSHSNQSGTAVMGTATQAGDGNPQNYQKRVPNLTQAQADQVASNMLADIVTHEMTVSAHLAGDPTVNAQRQLRVTGTGSAFDQIYYFTSVRHEWSPRKGHEMHLDARNHDTADAS